MTGVHTKRVWWLCAIIVLLSAAVASHHSALAQTCNAGGIRDDCCTSSGCNQQQCQAMGCCWMPVSSPHDAADKAHNASEPQQAPLTGVAWCFRSNPVMTGYQLTSMTPTANGFVGTLAISNGPNVFGADISPLRITVTFESQQRLHVKISDPNNNRWEVPNIVKSTTPPNKPANQDYIFSYTSSPFGFAVQRASTLETLFNTSSPSGGVQFNGLIFEDQYLELSTQLPRVPNIYGLGERIHPLRLDSSGAYYTMFTTDIGTPLDINLYASHPFYMEMRNSTPADAAHGVFLLNSNGMDVYLGPQQLTYRVIGGVLDMYFFMGPTPENVVQQYTEVIGRPYMPPYWAMGWHQCRYGWKTIQDVENVVQQYAANNLPLDTIWTDIDYMQNYYDFTWDPSRFPVSEVASFVAKLHSNGQHYVPIVDCGIPNDTNYEPWVYGQQLDVFIKDASGQPFIGKVWPGLTGWVDWFSPSATEYWVNSINKFLTQVPYDGLWIDMNEISNFCDGLCGSEVTTTKAKSEPFNPRNLQFDPNNPPYAINNRGDKQPLKTKTTTMDSTHAGGLLEYNTHNLFGYMETNATRVALETFYGKRAFVVSRSTFPGSGYVGNHWLGDNTSDWPDLYYAIPGILNFQMYGVPMVGADICGFNGDTTEELCARWMEVGAFYPFSRNHNTIGANPQEPYVWPTVLAASQTVLAIRYSLLPYYYTLFAGAHINGTTVARPLFFEFPSDTNCVWLDTQFLIGSGFLITPVLTQGATTVQGYFPQARWYDYYTHELLTTGPGYITLDAPLEKINLHLRGGTIIPTQGPALTTAAARLNPFGLLVPLDETGRATGYVFLDDGESIGTELSGQYTYIQYVLSANRVRANVINNGYAPAAQLKLTTVDVLGVNVCPTSVAMNGQSATFTCDPSVLAVHVSGFSVAMNSQWSLTWTA